eukprot:Platyproteum_vivax@DN7527_c0_g1_i1.p1
MTNSQPLSAIVIIRRITNFITMVTAPNPSPAKKAFEWTLAKHHKDLKQKKGRPYITLLDIIAKDLEDSCPVALHKTPEVKTKFIIRWARDSIKKDEQKFREEVKNILKLAGP